jgi:hypothetical protein
MGFLVSKEKILNFSDPIRLKENGSCYGYICKDPSCRAKKAPFSFL